MAPKIEYYAFDKIRANEEGDYEAIYGSEFLDVYPFSGEPDEELYSEGWAKCDAPGTETFVVSYGDAEYALRNGK